MRHLKQEEIIAFRDGKLEAPGAREHMATCGKCRSRLEDSRWLGILMGKAEEPAPGEHPSRDEIAGYLDEALSPSESSGLKTHLKACGRCAGILAGIRRASLESPRKVPRRALFRKVKESFREPSEIKSLGAIVVDALKGLRLRFLPDPEGYPPFAPEPMMLKTGPTAPGGAPASEWERVLERQGTEDRTEGREVSGSYAALEEEVLGRASEELEVTRESLGRDTMVAAAPRGEIAPISIEAPPWRLSLSVSGSIEEILLSAAVRYLETDEPADGVRFELFPPKGIAESARSDRQGRLRLSLPPGESRLQVGEQQPWTFHLVAPSPEKNPRV